MSPFFNFEELFGVNVQFWSKCTVLQCMCNCFVTSNENVFSKFGIQISCVIQDISVCYALLFSSKFTLLFLFHSIRNLKDRILTFYLKCNCKITKVRSIIAHHPLLVHRGVSSWTTPGFRVSPPESTCIHPIGVNMIS